MIEENTFSAALAPAWVRSRWPFVTPASVVTHSSSHCRVMSTSCGNSQGRCAPPSAAKNSSRSIEGLGDGERDALGAGVADVVEVHLGCRADHSLVLDPQGDRGVVEVHAGVLVEVGVERLVGQLDAVAVELGEADGQVPALGQCPHLDRRPGVCGLGDLPVAGDERERHAVDLGVLGLEPAGVGVDGVVAPPQAAADDLLAEQLAAERADAEDVGDGVGVPALGEHGDRDHAADVLAELALLADGVHRLAQQVGVGELVHVGARVAQPVGLLERLDLSRRRLPELGAERLAGFELLRVDEDRALPGASRRRPRRCSAAGGCRRQGGWSRRAFRPPGRRSSRRPAWRRSCSGTPRSAPAAARRARPGWPRTGRSSARSCGTGCAARLRAPPASPSPAAPCPRPVAAASGAWAAAAGCCPTAAGRPAPCRRRRRRRGCGGSSRCRTRWRPSARSR